MKLCTCLPEHIVGEVMSFRLSVLATYNKWAKLHHGPDFVKTGITMSADIKRRVIDTTVHVHLLVFV